MIEGGATVIRALLEERELVDTIIVTTSPRTVGEGVDYGEILGKSRDIDRFELGGSELFGEDEVVGWSSIL